jgi:hypothetical protein
MTAYAASRAWLVTGHRAGDEISHAGAKSYNKGKPIRIEEFEPEKVWRGRGEDGFKDRVENESVWRVSIAQIKAGNFNLDLRNPHNPDETQAMWTTSCPNTKSSSPRSPKPARG